MLLSSWWSAGDSGDAPWLRAASGLLPEEASVAPAYSSATVGPSGHEACSISARSMFRAVTQTGFPSRWGA